MLTRNHRQEMLSRAYVHAVAGCCGLSCSFREFDYGIDLTIHEIRRRGRRYCESGFKLDVQAKSTTARNLTDTHLVCDITATAYDDLRETDIGCPRILVMLVLPDDEANWTEQDEDRLLIRYAAYWLSLRGEVALPNRRSVRIEIPRGNLFSIPALEGIMEKVRRRETL